MADPSSDLPASGEAEGQQSSHAPDEQLLSDRDQTLADSDQTSSDTDQTAADGDQTASDIDQAASDEDLAHGGDPQVHEETRHQRDLGAEQRSESARRRYDAAANRDAAAAERERLARERDEAADRLDRELDARDAAWPGNGRARTAAEVVMGNAEVRRRAAEDRAVAAAARERAAADRRQAAADRERAARDRAQARIDRDALLLIAETDALTGARTRGAGLADLGREISRARRGDGRLVVAYVDVVGLKAVNDSRGHAAGDELLRRAVTAICAHLRPYDLVVRVGGDEFVCALSGLGLEDARRRFAAVQAALATAPEQSEIKVGLAELTPGATAHDLVARADADLPASPRP